MADAVVIAAPASGSGKTTVTLGLLRALRDAGVRVNSAKAGPDYIDPQFHAAATGRACLTLEPWAMRPALLADLAGRLAAEAEVTVIEGMMGLFDGTAAGDGSTADLAAGLGLPVILVVDCSGLSQSAAAVVHGFASLRPDVAVAGVILNRLGGERHAAMATAAIAPLGIPVLGCIRRDDALAVPSRHLGLRQAGELDDLEAFLAGAGRRLAAAVDLAALRRLCRPLAAAPAPAPLPPLGHTVAVAADAAFAFAYPHLLDGWRASGATVRPFSPLADEAPAADADAVYLPGGYPELHAGRLAAAGRFLAGLKAAAARGALVFGECGGYMVLGTGLTDAAGIRHTMAGLLPVETSFATPRLHLGYRRLAHDGALPLPRRLRGHEFHYSSLVSQGTAEPLFAAADAAGTALGPAGQRIGRVMGSYMHLVDAEATP